MIDSIVAFALGIAGVGCLFGSWKDQLPVAMRPTLLGWLLLIVSGYFATRASGAEFGTTLIFIAPALVAWILVAANLELRQAKTRKRKAADNGNPIETSGARPWSRHLLLFFITVPLSAIATTFVSVALARTLPWTDLSQMVLAIMLMPFLWGCAAYWVLADGRLARPLVAILALGSISAATVWL